MFARHLGVMSGGIGYCTCIPVQPGGALGKTSNDAEVPWNNSKLKIFNLDKRRNKTIQGKLKHQATVRGLWMLGVMKNNALLHSCQFLSCPIFSTKRRGEGSHKRENAFVQNSL